MSKKVYIRTFGCQMNVRDSEFIAGLFLEKGYRLCSSPKEADAILFNTCAVREHAQTRAINNVAQLMSKYNSRVYGIVGCAAQALKDELFRKLPKLDIVCGTGEIARLPALVKRAANEKILALNDIDRPLPELKLAYREDGKSAYVSIMRGCNNFCSYCIVPYVRGKERSRKVDDISDEVKDLVRQGIRNITLLGQNVNSYRGRGKPYNFIELLEEINKIEGLKKINFMTSHPKDANTELFKAMRDLDKLVKHLHLPLQSGSDRILKLMNRAYTTKTYSRLIAKAREIVPGLRVTSDIIVGFPTEKETNFKATLNLVKAIKFDMAYIFKYSPRPGTKACEMKDDVPQELKKRRHRILLELQRKISKRKKGVEAEANDKKD